MNIQGECSQTWILSETSVGESRKEYQQIQERKKKNDSKKSKITWSRVNKEGGNITGKKVREVTSHQIM